MQKDTSDKKRFSNIKDVILVASGKGGVGKSTVAASLALALAKEGNKVGLLDADIYGPSVPTLFNLENKKPLIQQVNEKTMLIPFMRDGVKLMSLGFLVEKTQAIIWRGPKVSSGICQLLDDTNWGELDYLIIDTPPGTGDAHITLLQNYDLSGVIVVTTPQQMALADVRKAIDLYQDNLVGIPILGIVENMAWFSPSVHPEEKYYLFGKNGGKTLSQEYNIPLIIQLPQTEQIALLADSGHLSDILNNEELSPYYAKLISAIEMKLCINKFQTIDSNLKDERI